MQVGGEVHCDRVLRRGERRFQESQSWEKGSESTHDVMSGQEQTENLTFCVFLFIILLLKISVHL